MGFLRGALSLTITPLTFDEFRRAGFSVPDERVFDQLNTLDPAECKDTLLHTHMHPTTIVCHVIHIHLQLG